MPIDFATFVTAEDRARNLALSRNSPQQKIKDAARRVPDETFAEHPEIVSLTEEVKDWERRSKYVTQTHQTEAEKTIAKLQSRLAQLVESQRFAALDDLMAGDFEQQPRAMAVSQSLEQVRRQLDSARMAREEVGRSPLSNGIPGRYLEQLAQARTNLQEALLRLKTEHIQAHPELLG